MAYCEIHWFSGVLSKQVTTGVILPDGGKGPFATYYLLHGLSDDYSIWHRRTRIEEYAGKYPLIVVMPDGFRNFYTDNTSGPAYAKYIGEELPTMIERVFPAKAARSARAIGGLSMGGYGGLRIGLGYPDRFISCNSHSGAMMAGSRNKGRPHWIEWAQVFGKKPRGTDHDLVHLAKKSKAAGMVPKIRIDCGTEDFLIADNREYHRVLQEMKIDHEYEEFPGAHNWDYWDLHVREALAFHARAMKLKAK